MTLDSGGTTILSFRGGAQEYQWGNSAQIRVAFQKRVPSWIDTDTFGFALVAGEAAKAKSSLGSDALRLLDPGLGRGVTGVCSSEVGVGGTYIVCFESGCPLTVQN